MKLTKGISTGYLDDLWRTTVRFVWNHRCAKCGVAGNLEAHHYFPRRIAMTRWNWRNGILLCKWKCHKFAHTKEGDRWVEGALGPKVYSSLNKLSKIILKQHHVKTGMSNSEFRQKVKKELIDKLKTTEKVEFQSSNGRELI